VPVHKSRGEVATVRPPLLSGAAESVSCCLVFLLGDKLCSYNTAAPIITTGTTYRMTFRPGVACAAAPTTEAVAMGDTLE
jgi:hypothetical protein